MVVSSLASSKHCNISEKHLDSTHLRPSSKLFLKQNDFIYVFTMVGYIRPVTTMSRQL